jgi:hypothetical protein
MVAMLTELANLSLFDLGTHLITELRFETNDGVDDLVIVTDDGPRIFVQAKRSLSLSSGPTSPFYSVIGQFVDQFVRDPHAQDIYLLATTPIASSRVLRDLHKLTEAARLNELGHSANPLTRVEQDVLTTTYSLLNSHFSLQTGRVMTDAERATVFRRIHVAALDLESGGSLERAVLTVLASRTTIAPTLVWNSLVALSLTLAKDRLTIDRHGLDLRAKKYFARTGAPQPIPTDNELLGLMLESDLPASREVVLVRYDEHMLIMELERFAEGGTRQVRFADGQLQLGRSRFEVILRAATMDGMERLISADINVLEDRAVVVIPINSNEDMNSSPWVQAHIDLCRQHMHLNSALLECLRCGRPVSENLAPVVEIDEEGQPHQVGLSHRRCLRPTYRVIGHIEGGLFETHPMLADFDYRTWLSARPTGQGLFSTNPEVGRIKKIAWKPRRDHLSIGTWGVAHIIEDGSIRYATERGRVQRLTKSQAEEMVLIIERELRHHSATNDPLCFSGQSELFANYSQLVRTEHDAQPLRIRSVEVRELDRATITAHSDVENFYAPLVALIDEETNTPFIINDTAFLITDPLTLANKVKNWEAAGIEIPMLATAILRSDDQFDAFVAGAMLDGHGVLIDPVLDLQAHLMAGYIVAHFDSLMAQAIASENNSDSDSIDQWENPW